MNTEKGGKNTANLHKLRAFGGDGTSRRAGYCEIRFSIRNSIKSIWKKCNGEKLKYRIKFSTVASVSYRARVEKFFFAAYGKRGFFY